MVNLGQKLKCQKHAKNHSTTTLQLLCAKNRSKKHQIFQNETIFKIGQLEKAIAHAKAIRLAKWSEWVKNAKAIGFPKWSVWVKK